MRHRSTIRFAAVVATSLALAVDASAGTIDVHVRHDEREIAIQARAVVAADAATAWRVLTDYARYPEFVPGVRECRVLARSPEAVVVLQEGTAFLGPIRRPVTTAYTIVETPLRAIRSSGNLASIGTLASEYAIDDREGGVALSYAGRLVLQGTSLPALEAVAARETVALQFGALVDEIERTYRAAHGAAEARRSAQPAPRRRRVARGGTISSAIDPGTPASKPS